MELLLLFSKTMTKAFFLSLSNLEHSSDEVATQMFWVNPSGKQYSPYQRYQSSLPNVPQNMATPQRGCSLKYLNLKIIQHKGTLGQVIEAGLGQVREAASACSFSSFPQELEQWLFFLFAQLGSSISLLLNPFLSLEYLLGLGL